MVMRSRPRGDFRSPLDRNYDLSGPNQEIWVRTAEVSGGSANPAGATGFLLGLEDRTGQRAWANSDDVGAVPRPFDQAPTTTKTMLTTVRFPVRCFRPEKRRFDRSAVAALLIRYDRTDERELAFDVIQIVSQ